MLALRLSMRNGKFTSQCGKLPQPVFKAFTEGAGGLKPTKARHR